MSAGKRRGRFLFRRAVVIFVKVYRSTSLSLSFNLDKHRTILVMYLAPFREFAQHTEADTFPSRSPAPAFATSPRTELCDRSQFERCSSAAIPFAARYLPATSLVGSGRS